MDPRWHLSHARGYLELGMLKDALAELNALPPALAASEEALALRATHDWPVHVVPDPGYWQSTLEPLQLPLQTPVPQLRAPTGVPFVPIAWHVPKNPPTLQAAHCDVHGPSQQ